MTPAERVVRLGEASFRVADGKDGFWDRYEAGQWEPETLAALRRHVGPGVTLVDIGSWIGPISLAALALDATVLAFEPDPRAHELFSANLLANPGFAGRVALHHRALAPKAQILRLGSPRKPGDSMGSVLLADRAATTFEAETITPDIVSALCASAKSLVVKLDVEGFEYELLPHLGPLLGPRTEAALIALHPKILLATGRGRADIEAATARALAPLAGFRSTILDGTALTGANVTVLFERE